MIEDDRKLFSSGVIDEIEQLRRLAAAEPPIPLEEIAHRMATTSPKVRQLLRLLNIDHEGLHRPLNPDRAAAAQTKRRLRREATAAAALEEKNRRQK